MRNAKVVQAIVATYEEKGDTTSAAKLCKRVVDSGLPKSGVSWAKGKLKEYSKAMDEAAAKHAAAKAGVAPPPSEDDEEEKAPPAAPAPPPKAPAAAPAPAAKAPAASPTPAPPAKPTAPAPTKASEISALMPDRKPLAKRPMDYAGRMKARGLYKEARVAMDGGDEDTALAKWLEGHAEFPSPKVVDALLAVIEKKNDVRTGTEVCLGILETEQPKARVKTCQQKLAVYGPALAELMMKEEEARRQAEAEAKRKAEEEEKRRAEEEERKKAEAVERQKALEEAKRLALEEAKKRATAKPKGAGEAGVEGSAPAADAAPAEPEEKPEWMKKMPFALTVTWASLAGVAAISGIAALFFDSQAESEIDKATTCVRDLHAGVPCPAATYDKHVADAKSADDNANVAGIVAASAAGLAAVTAILRYTVFVEDAPAAEPAPAKAQIQVTPAGLVFTGTF